MLLKERIKNNRFVVGSYFFDEGILATVEKHLVFLERMFLWYHL